MMRYYIHKPDLDTCLTALILGVTRDDRVIVLRRNADPKLLVNPQCTCIEVGGSGQKELNNFDHHDPCLVLQPACRQAYDISENENQQVKRLVDYVCMVDDPQGRSLRTPFPSLSNIFSGMLLVTETVLEQFHVGVDILNKVLIEHYDPFATMPILQQWKPYIKAKQQNAWKISEAGILDLTLSFTTASGRKAGFLSLEKKHSQLIIGPGMLYSRGYNIVIILSPAFGNPPVRKFIVAGNEQPVSHLLKHIALLEPGWGGRKTIIGSPRQTGSNLAENIIIDLVKKYA